MKNFLKLIRFLGVQEKDSYTEKRSIILLNEITLLILIIETIVYVEFLIIGKWREILLIFFVQIITIIPLFFNYYQKRQAAKWYFSIVFMIAITLIIMAHGWELRADYCFLIFVLTSMLFFTKWINRVFLWTLIIVCYYFSLYYTTNYPAILAENVSFLTSSVSFLVVLITIIIIIFRFIGETENYEEELKKTLKELKKEEEITALQNKKLEQANVELERFAYISSHNLKTPIRTIRSFTDLIERNYDRGNTEYFKEYLGFIKQGTAQMQLLITDILEFSRFNQQKNIEITEVDLNEVTYYIHSQIQSFTDKNIELEIGELPIIKSNQTFINTIFHNIIENGIKYNESETVRIQITYETKGEEHLVIFTDNGIGIDTEYQDKIFGMFQRLHNDSKYEGTGIGLAMVKKMVEKLNGKISLKSSLGNGSTFFLMIPK